MTRAFFLLLLAAATLPAQPRATVFQTSTIDALLQGVYDGQMTFSELRRHGDFGIGTFNGVDGEMIALNGRFFQITSDGKAHRVPPTARTPFATVTPFTPDLTLPVTAPLSLASLYQAIDKALPSPNYYYAIRIRGHFRQVTTRSVPRQKPPYPPLAEVVKTQPIFHLDDTEGTLAGFRCPDFARGVNVPGYHLHYLNKSETNGGHVLALDLEKGTIEISIKKELKVSLPETDSFKKADLRKDRTQDLQKVEK